MRINLRGGGDIASNPDREWSRLATFREKKAINGWTQFAEPSPMHNGWRWGRGNDHDKGPRLKYAPDDDPDLILALDGLAKDETDAHGAGEAIPGPTRALDGSNEENHLEEIKTPQRGF